MVTVGDAKNSIEISFTSSRGYLSGARAMVKNIVMTKEESILIAKLRLAYRKNPIAFCRDLLDIELSQQQEPLFLDMIKWDDINDIQISNDGKTIFILSYKHWPILIKENSEPIPLSLLPVPY